ncbi:Serine/threonine-protein kinase 32C [Escovopsis weberi]|uniref:Serine/threonine-protein kinase 32C n=1 Tax=Escovopsis weberi TaxID=150374 RepID=A0A0M8MS99_ESCWE|nr:Serine/threonine-protein kinase 32C [Escovopsis weberi]
MGNGQGKPADVSGETNLNHFRLLRVVGRGAFGKVRIVERKDTGLTFALKYIRKDEVIKSESVRNIIRERRMLEHVSHPFLCNLRYSFQDIEYMYLVVDLMSGGDLRFHIARKTFTEEAVQFWIAELGCALRYIHGQNIIHRDVKPDNVLLDAEGHVHLTDFNVATDVIPGKQVTSKSGTLAYLAPEVYAGNGYDIRADWWSLGVLFYECIYNREIREYELHQMIEHDFRPYDYTVAAYQMLTRAQGLENDELKKVIPDSLRPGHDPLLSAHPVRNSVPAMASTNGSPISKTTSATHPPLNEKHSGARPPAFGNSAQHRIHHLTPTKKGVPGPAGGVSFRLDGSESWSDIARQDTTLPKDAAHTAVSESQGKLESSGGVFGFLKHKKHRNNSPKPRERGVLGKEGARVVVS